MGAIRKSRPSRLSNLILVECQDSFYYEPSMLAANDRRFYPVMVNAKPFTVKADDNA